MNSKVVVVPTANWRVELGIVVVDDIFGTISVLSKNSTLHTSSDYWFAVQHNTVVTVPIWESKENGKWLIAKNT